MRSLVVAPVVEENCAEEHVVEAAPIVEAAPAPERMFKSKTHSSYFD